MAEEVITVIDGLVKEMQAAKEKYPTLNLQDILRLFAIESQRNLTTEISKLRRMYNG
jgi:hypothetical protein